MKRKILTLKGIPILAIENTLKALGLIGGVEDKDANVCLEPNPFRGTPHGPIGLESNYLFEMEHRKAQALEHWRISDRPR